MISKTQILADLINSRISAKETYLKKLEADAAELEYKLNSLEGAFQSWTQQSSTKTIVSNLKQRSLSLYIELNQLKEFRDDLIKAQLIAK